MIGPIIGVISSIVIFTFFTKDEKAVKEHRLQKEKQQKQKQEIVKKQQEQRQKMMNDPQLKKKREEASASMKERLFKNLSQEDRVSLQKFIAQKKQTGKTDEQIMKDQSVKVMCFLFFMVCVIIMCIVGIVIVTDFDVSGVTSDVVSKGRDLLSFVYPKMAAGQEL